MKRGSTLGGLCLATALLVAAPASGDGPADVQVLGNGQGDTPAWPQEALRWYETRLPTLPLDYPTGEGFIPYAPAFDYLDEVNWSLLGLAQFAEVQKARWVRVPAGQKVRRDPATGAWRWPPGSETAKLFRARTLDAAGNPVWTDLELRLAKKLRDDPDPRQGWAMGLYVRARPPGQGWVVVRPPALRLDVEGALVPGGGTRTVVYTLTPPEGCLTCHAHARSSPVDLERGNELVYGANDELLTGRARLRLSQWKASAALRGRARELSRDEARGWVEVQSTDLQALRANRAALAGILEGALPPEPR